ncbi:MAG: T9SS type A sorting domain-containing protein [Bacteroidetes bacterium]|nr:T9SS type A sorting domain-containing protein [Bacteroidota bacterium]
MRKLLLLTSFCFLIFNLNAQKTVKIIINETSSNLSDCDFIGGDSDPIWWWAVNGSYKGCFETSCNGCTIPNLGKEVLKNDYSCTGDFPSTLDLSFSACENDGASCSSVWLVFTGICDGDVADLTAGKRTDNLNIPTANGTYPIGPFTVRSGTGTFGGCVADFTYSGYIQVSGSFIDSPNDNICDATAFQPGGDNVLSAGESAQITGQSNINCTGGQSGEPNNPRNTVWYKFNTGPQASLGANVQVDLYNDYCEGFACTAIPWLGVYKSNRTSCGDFGGLQEIVKSPAVIGSKSVAFCPQANSEYLVQVDRTSFSGWNFNFDIGVSMNSAINAADNICEATNIVGAGNFELGSGIILENQSNRCAGKESGEPTVDNILHDGSLFRDVKSVWYYFETGNIGNQPASVRVDMTSLNSTIDAHVAIFKSNGACNNFGNLSLVAEGGLHPGNGNNLFTLNDDATALNIEANSRYYIQCIGEVQDLPTLYDAHQGEFNLKIGFYPVPANDDICAATDLGQIDLGENIALNNQSSYNASEEDGEPNVFSTFYDNATVWYKFTTNGSESLVPSKVAITATSVANIDAHINVYKSNGSCGFSEIGGVAQGGLPGTGSNDILTKNDDVDLFCLEANTTYWVRVSGWEIWLQDNHHGIFNLNFNASLGATNVSNDNVCNAKDLGNGAPILLGQNILYTNQSTNCATEQSGEPNTGSLGVDDATIWYKFTTAADLSNVPAYMAVNTKSIENLDSHIEIFKSNGGCNFSDLSSVVEGGLPGTGLNDILTKDDDVEFICLDPNKSYWIQISGWNYDLFTVDHQGVFNLEVKSSNGDAGVSNDDLCDATDLGNGSNVSKNFSVNLTNESSYCASEQSGEPNTGSSIDIYDDASVWYSFSVDQNSANIPAFIKIKLTSKEDIDGHLIVYKGKNEDCSFSNLTEVTKGGLPGTGWNDLLTKDDEVYLGCGSIEPGQTYWIQVTGWELWLTNNHWGLFDLNVSGYEQPLNDNVLNAKDLNNDQPVALGQNIALDNQSSYCAGEEPNEPNTFSILTDVSTLWYKFKTNSDPNLVPNGASFVVNSKEDIDAHVALFKFNGSVDYNNIEMLAEGGLPLSGLNDLFTKNDDVDFGCLDPNTTYYLQVSGWELLATENHHGVFDLSANFNSTAKPSHDNIVDAIELTTNGGVAVFSNNCATVEPKEPRTIEDEIYDISPSNTVWHKFRTPNSTVNSIRTTISTDHSATNFDTEMTLWYSRDGSADAEDMVQIAYADDIQFLINTKSFIEVDKLIPNALYYIQMDGDDASDQGSYGISVTAEDGTPLPVGPVYFDYYYAKPGDKIGIKTNNNLLILNSQPVKAVINKKGQNQSWIFNKANLARTKESKSFFEPDGFLTGAVYTALCELGCPTRCEQECGSSDPLNACYSLCNIGCGFECLDDWLGYNLAYESLNDIKLGPIKFEDFRNVYKITSGQIEAGALSTQFKSGLIDLPLAAPYTDRDIVLKFPFGWGSQHEDNSTWAIDLGAAVFGLIDLKLEENRTRKVEVQGYGGLVLGSTLYPNAIKVRTLLKDNLKVNLLGQLNLNIENDLPDVIYPDNTVLYEWWVPGYEIPLVSVWGTVENNKETFWKFSWWDDSLRNDPIANFVANTQSPVNKLSDKNIDVIFANKSENATRYEWNFGDNTTSIETNPKHTYLDAGTYTIKLKAFNDDDLLDTYEQTITLINESSAPQIAQALSSHFKNEIKGLPTNSAFSVYPNPFRDAINVRINGTNKQALSIKLYDNLGRNLVVLFDGDMEQTFNDNFDLSAYGFSNGVYFLEINTNGVSEMIKLVRN